MAPHFSGCICAPLTAPSPPASPVPSVCDGCPAGREGGLHLDFQSPLDAPLPKYNTQLPGHDTSVITKGKKPRLDREATRPAPKPMTTVGSTPPRQQRVTTRTLLSPQPHPGHAPPSFLQPPKLQRPLLLSAVAATTVSVAVLCPHGLPIARDPSPRLPLGVTFQGLHKSPFLPRDPLVGHAGNTLGVTKIS